MTGFTSFQLFMCLTAFVVRQIKCETATLDDQCQSALESPLVTGDITAPSTGSSGTSSDFVAALNGMWTSTRCEISAGPTFTYRRYIFYSSRENDNYFGINKEMSPRVFFRVVFIIFIDSDCKTASHAFNAEGDIEVAHSMTQQLFAATPGGEEAVVNIYRVSTTVFNMTNFAQRLKKSDEPNSLEKDFPDICSFQRLWPNIDEYIKTNGTEGTMHFNMYNSVEPMANWYFTAQGRRYLSEAGERDRNVDRLECLKKAGFNADELLLLRIEQRVALFEAGFGNVSILKTGQVFKSTYKPSMYETNVLLQFNAPYIATVCPICVALSRSELENNSYEKFLYHIRKLPSARVKVADAGFLLPNIQPEPSSGSGSYKKIINDGGDQWVSTRCETRPYSVFLMRHLYFNASTFRGIYSYFEDPFCQVATYDLEIGGTYEFVQAIYDDTESDKTPFASTYTFNTTWARLRPRNDQAVTTLSEYSQSEVNSCGLKELWKLGVWQDVSETGGCLAIGVRVPNMELQLIRLEASANDSNKAVFLYVGDAHSKRMKPSA